MSYPKISLVSYCWDEEETVSSGNSVFQGRKPFPNVSEVCTLIYVNGKNGARTVKGG